MAAKPKGKKVRKPNTRGMETVTHFDLEVGDWIDGTVMNIRSTVGRQTGKVFLLVDIHVTDGVIKGDTIPDLPVSGTMTAGAVLTGRLQTLRPSLMDRLVIERVADLPSVPGQNPAKGFNVFIERRAESDIVPVALLDAGDVQEDPDPAEEGDHE